MDCYEFAKRIDAEVNVRPRNSKQSVEATLRVMQFAKSFDELEGFAQQECRSFFGRQFACHTKEFQEVLEFVTVEHFATKLDVSANTYPEKRAISHATDPDTIICDASSISSDEYIPIGRRTPRMSRQKSFIGTPLRIPSPVKRPRKSSIPVSSPLVVKKRIISRQQLTTPNTSRITSSSSASQQTAASTSSSVSSAGTSSRASSGGRSFMAPTQASIARSASKSR